ncbi:hypothetical protein OG589_33740 [Sphaerisporangium sp. NBC_01403]
MRFDVAELQRLPEHAGHQTGMARKQVSEVTTIFQCHSSTAITSTATW